ncbi:MAG: response regulator transcription factor [Psychrobium sp.]
MSISVLLVEDDIDLASTIVDYLEIEDITCDHAANGVLGLTLIEQNNYDVILLDINLPRLDGLSVCQQARNASNETPVLMLTAKDTLEDKIAGFNAGTDDYLVKPFEMDELVIRIIALSKRRSKQITTLAIENLTLDLQTKSARSDVKELKLTPITFKLLKMFMQDTNEPISRESLMRGIWGDFQPDSNSLKVHIHHLRKQFERCDVHAAITNKPGLGFILHGTKQL